MFEGQARFVSGASARFKEFKQSAEQYTRRLSDNQALGLWQKPLDWHKGHPSFLNEMFQLLDGIQAMKLEPGSTVVEVGSGAGWATEWLAGLKYKVICLEPSGTMIDVAKRRVQNFLEIHRMTGLLSNVTWHCTTIEEASLRAESVDAILFFESFHHVIDEQRAVLNSHRILRPGGVLCILGDSNWIPGNQEQESAWQQEMELFGSLESPFTHTYLTHLLETNGFSDVTRYHAVNQLIPVSRDNEPVRTFVSLDAVGVNLFVAKKSALKLAPAKALSAAEQQKTTIAEEPSHAQRGWVEQWRDELPIWVRPYARWVWRMLQRLRRSAQSISALGRVIRR